MKLFYTDQFVLPLPDGHRFPMRKYTDLRHRVLDAPWARSSQFHVPEAAADEDLLRAHDPGYLGRVRRGELERAEVRRIGFPWSPELVERSARVRVNARCMLPASRIWISTSMTAS